MLAPHLGYDSISIVLTALVQVHVCNFTAVCLFRLLETFVWMASSFRSELSHASAHASGRDCNFFGVF